MPKPRQHGQRHGRGARPAREAVGVREQVPFERGRLRVEITDRGWLLADAHEELGVEAQLLVENARDVKPVGTFRNHDGAEVDVALDELPVNFKRSERAIEEVFAGFDRPVAQEIERVQDKKRYPVGQHAA